ncbi:MAG: prepilin-type N-terminal cleavage/methylation domain-containing protein [Proteobacteria bacterium]|nr:prepilin-type N-terminal cleavage/methylation domain-containing protein [Pseudomonadota bacterium]
MSLKRRKSWACPNSCARVNKIRLCAGTGGSKKEAFLCSGTGFTLLEVLIAVGIFSLVLVALYSTFFLSLRAMNMADESLLKLQEARFFLDTLKREIESAVYSDEKLYTVFKIDDRDYYGRQTSRIIMTSLSPLIKGLSKIRYAVEERDGKLIIRKSMITAFTQVSEDKGMDLLEDVASFTLEVKLNDRWVKTWDSRLAKSTPEEVRITLAMFIRDKEKGGYSGMPFSVSEIAIPRIGRKI